MPTQAVLLAASRSPDTEWKRKLAQLDTLQPYVKRFCSLSSRDAMQDVYESYVSSANDHPQLHRLFRSSDLRATNITAELLSHNLKHGLEIRMAALSAPPFDGSGLTLSLFAYTIDAVWTSTAIMLLESFARLLVGYFLMTTAYETHRSRAG